VSQFPGYIESNQSDANENRRIDAECADAISFLTPAHIDPKK
jgi:hypothetical protein